MLLAAWVLVLVYFYLAAIHPTTHFGIFFLPLVLGLVVAGWLTPKEYRFAREPSKILGTVHGISMLAATVTVLFGFAAGLMYLWQAQRLKQKRRRAWPCGCRAWSGCRLPTPAPGDLDAAHGVGRGFGNGVKLARRGRAARACDGT